MHSVQAPKDERRNLCDFCRNSWTIRHLHSSPPQTASADKTMKTLSQDRGWWLEKSCAWKRWILGSFISTLHLKCPFENKVVHIIIARSGNRAWCVSLNMEWFVRHVRTQELKAGLHSWPRFWCFFLTPFRYQTRHFSHGVYLVINYTLNYDLCMTLYTHI